MYDNSFSNFGRPLVPDDSCKGSAPRHSRFWRRRFLKVFTIYGRGGHLGQRDRYHLSNFSFPHPKEAPYEIWAKLAQRLQRRSRLKMLTDEWTDGRRTKSDHNSSSWAELRIAKNVTFGVLTRFPFDLAWWPSFWPHMTQFQTWLRNHQDKHFGQNSWWLLQKCDL